MPTDTTVSTTRPEKKASMRRIGLSSLVGTAMEWYDFFIYTTASALVFNVLFFPDVDPRIGTVLAFSTIAAGFLARPVGAILLGQFGDKIGRKSVLILTLVTMGVATFLMGLMPTFQQIGLWAPVLLVLLRVIQGLAVGGEWSGAVLIASENAPAGRKTFWASFAQMGSPIGLIVATSSFAILQNVSTSDFFIEWGWRIPFLFAGLLVPIGLWIRLSIDDAPEFKKAAETQRKSSVPFFQLLKHGWKGLLIGTGAFLGIFGIYYLFTSFVLAYATGTLGMSAGVVLPTNIIGPVSQGIGIAIGVWIAKRFTARWVAALSAIIMGVWSIPAFALMGTAEPAALYTAVAVGLFFVGTSYGVLAGEVAELFTPTQRYTGIGLNYHLAGVLGGGLMPLAATYMLTISDSMNGIIALCIGVAVIMFICCLLMPKTNTATRQDQQN